LTPLEVNDSVDRFLKENRALLRVYDAREPHGVVRAVVNRTRDVTQFLPTVILRNEDYGRVARVLASGAKVKLEFNVVNRLFPEGRTQFNAVAEIPGTDKRDELVMLGAHIDAHHLATGATDNAVGCAIMIEAVRILRALNAKPRRTVRIGLWSGEEQRVLGSQAYVREHFGSAENPKKDFDKLSAYFNLDTGTGRIRGMRPFGPPATGEVLRQITAPFADLGIAGAATYSNRTAPGSDHAAFSVNGLPGVYVDQDPLRYGEFTWHTSLDTFERIHEPDAKQAAIVIASAVYHLAMREEKLPRFTKENMPPLNYFPAPVPTPQAQTKRASQ
jgi:Zn-dependent M28 family amino/carboxypeptidase